MMVQRLLIVIKDKRVMAHGIKNIYDVDTTSVRKSTRIHEIPSKVANFVLDGAHG